MHRTVQPHPPRWAQIGLSFSLAVGLVLFVGSPSPAGALGQPGTPPKVKTSPARSTGFHPPRGGVTVPRGDATRLGFCGGDDWEPEIATDPGSRYVYVVWAHFPGDPTCDPSSGNQNRIYIRVSSDDGKRFGPAHVVADTVGGVD